MAETQTPNLDQSQAEPLEAIDATEMDSLMLDDDIGNFSTPLEPLTEKELEMEQESAPVEESGYEEPEFSAEPDKPEASSETVLEDNLAANHFSEQEEDELDFEPATSLQGGFSDLSTRAGEAGCRHAHCRIETPPRCAPGAHRGAA